MSVNTIQSALDVPTAVAAGASQRIDHLTNLELFVFGTFVQTHQIQISSDDVEFFDEGAAITVKGRLTIPDAAMFIRVNTTANTSGQATIHLVGVQSQ